MPQMEAETPELERLFFLYPAQRPEEARAGF